MSGISRGRVARLLEKNEVQFTRTGDNDKRVVFLSELERRLPDLIDSIRFRSDDE